VHVHLDKQRHVDVVTIVRVILIILVLDFERLSVLLQTFVHS